MIKFYEIFFGIILWAYLTALATTAVGMVLYLIGFYGSNALPYILYVTAIISGIIIARIMVRIKV